MFKPISFLTPTKNSLLIHKKLSSEMHSFRSRILPGSGRRFCPAQLQPRAGHPAGPAVGLPAHRPVWWYVPSLYTGPSQVWTLTTIKIVILHMLIQVKTMIVTCYCCICRSKEKVNIYNSSNYNWYIYSYNWDAIDNFISAVICCRVWLTVISVMMHFLSPLIR